MKNNGQRNAMNCFRQVIRNMGLLIKDYIKRYNNG